MKKKKLKSKKHSYIQADTIVISEVQKKICSTNFWFVARE